MRASLRTLLVAISLLGATAVLSADMVAISADALLTRAQKMDESFVIVDVRTPEEFAQGHVPGAINIPHDKIAEQINELVSAKNKDVVLYCKSGKRSALAADALRAQGFVRLLHLHGDIQLWIEEHRPIEK